jgi:hypothetical protein
MLSTKSGAGLVSGSAPQPTEEAQMLIDVIRGFVFDGRDVKIGEQLEVPEKFGRQMIQLGRATLAGDAPAAAPVQKQKKKKVRYGS